MNKRVRIIIMEPDDLLRDSISLYIQDLFSETISIVTQVNSLCQLRMAMTQFDFDVVLTDLYGEQETLYHWCDFYEQYKIHWPDKPILAWTDVPEYYMSYVNSHINMPYNFNKSIPLDELNQILQLVACGKSALLKRPQFFRPVSRRNFLTRRELQVINCLFRGEVLGRIAKRMGRSLKTVSGHKRNAMRKLGVESDGMLLSLNKKYSPLMIPEELGNEDGDYDDAAYP